MTRCCLWRLAIFIGCILPSVLCEGWAPRSKSEFAKAIRACLNHRCPNGPIGSWDVSYMGDMSRLFVEKVRKYDMRMPGAHLFNGDLSKWDVSSAITMRRMFMYVTSFNGNISKWDVSRVTHMQEMFSYAKSFNGDISEWDVSSVAIMANMFEFARSFNGDISKWDVSWVTDMRMMFYHASSFAQTLCGAWRTSTATAKHHQMFDGSSGKLCPKTTDDEEERILFAVFGALISLCAITVVTVVICRCCCCKATRMEQAPRMDSGHELPRMDSEHGLPRVMDNGHAIQRADTPTAGVIDILTKNSIDDLPTATETDSPIATATLTMPPALTEDMDVLPTAVAPVI